MVVVENRALWSLFFSDRTTDDLPSPFSFLISVKLHWLTLVHLRCLREDPIVCNNLGLELWIGLKQISTEMLTWWLQDVESANSLLLVLTMDIWLVKWAQSTLQSFFQEYDRWLFSVVLFAISESCSCRTILSNYYAHFCSIWNLSSRRGYRPLHLLLVEALMDLNLN